MSIWSSLVKLVSGPLRQLAVIAGAAVAAEYGSEQAEQVIRRIPSEFVHPQEDGSVMVQLAAQLGPDGTDPNLDHRAPIQDELLRNPDLKSAVVTLAAQAWTRVNQQIANGFDLRFMDPEGHA